MMELMRNLAKTFLAKILLGLLVVAFGVWGVSGIAGSAFDSALSITGWGPKDLAQVGGVVVGWAAVRRKEIVALQKDAHADTQSHKQRRQEAE